MTTGLDYIRRKYGKDNYLDFHEEARAYNQGVLDAIDTLAGKLDDMFADENTIDYVKNCFLDREEFENE